MVIMLLLHLAVEFSENIVAKDQRIYTTKWCNIPRTYTVNSQTDLMRSNMHRRFAAMMAVTFDDKAM